MYRKGNINTEKVENVCLQGAGKFGFGRYKVNWWKGWLEARPLVEWAALIHWIKERRRKKDKLHLIQAIVLL